MKPCDKNIKDVLKIARQMIKLAETGDAEREDIGCGVLYGVMLDAGHKIKKMAEDEKKAHQKKGWWK